MYPFLYPFPATLACWGLPGLTEEVFFKYLILKEKYQFLRGLSGGWEDPGFKMVCLPISPLPHGGEPSKYSKNAGGRSIRWTVPGGSAR